jgi:hypothetical protein
MVSLFCGLFDYMKRVGFLVIAGLVHVACLWGQTNACQGKYIWAVWNNFSGTSATAALNYSGVNIGMTMTSNFSFGSTPSIFGYNQFSKFSSVVPNTTVPETTWSAGVGGTTTMCFSQPVTNPILLFSSLGSPFLTVSLSFSQPYTVVYDGGGMNYTSSWDGNVNGQILPTDTYVYAITIICENSGLMVYKGTVILVR